MARKSGLNIENNFNGGLVTEANFLAFPENSCQETWNCLFRNNGEVWRRLGFEYEDYYKTTAITRSSSSISEYVWKSVAGNGDIEFVVVQVDSTLYFYQANEFGGISTNKLPFTIDLTTYQISGSPAVDTLPCQYSVGNGYLFVVHSYCTPFYIKYNILGDSFSTVSIVIQIRDFEGVDDTLAIDTRPSTLSVEHNYNLYNQSWFPTVTVASGGSFQAVAYWSGNRSDYPSNADVWWVFKNANRAVDFSLFNTIIPGNTAAPKGHYIVDPFLLDRTAVSGIGSFKVQSSSYYRPSTVEFFAGRIFYSGIHYQGYNNKIYFSQILEADTQIGRCYQADDPTSETTSGLLASDGGVIVIADIGNIIKLISIQTTLLVFASNGIWSISGSQGIGFAANDYTVHKISSIPALTASSFVMVEGYPVWWNTVSIYTVSANSATGTLAVQSVSDTKIRSFFLEIPLASKRYAKGAYSPETRTIQWLYNSNIQTSIDANSQYNSILCLDGSTQAFFPWSISSGPNIVGIVATRGNHVQRENYFQNTTVNATVVDAAGDTLLDAAGDTVVSGLEQTVPGLHTFRYITAIPTGDVNYNLTFSAEKDITYNDWATYGSKDYSSYLITGVKLHGQAVLKFQANYLYVFLRRQDTSSAFLQTVYDFADAGNFSQYSTTQQAYSSSQEVYLNRQNTTINYKRLQVRGTALSLQLKIKSEAGKPFNIVGWTIYETSNLSV